MKKLSALALSLCLPWCANAGAGPAAAAPAPATPGKTAMTEARAAVERGLSWLAAQQNKDGHWSNPEYPALTALPVWALTLAGRSSMEPAQQGVRFILGCVRENGGIYVDPKEQRKGGGLSNYNTAICMTALHLLGEPQYTPVVLKARAFLARSQHRGEDDFDGGMGYDADTGRAYADLSNSYIAYEAMRMTESAEDLRPPLDPHADLDWKAVEGFVQRTQNDAAFNRQPWASDEPADQGGFVYLPGQTRAGSYTNHAGQLRLRSMQGMSYAGLLSYLYAKVERNDPRVKATVKWVAANWALDRQRALTDGDKEGLYYLYNVLAKGLAAYGMDELTPPSRPAIRWRDELARRLVELQKVETDGQRGYWVNEVGRYMESDPVLVTSYSLIALQIALDSHPDTHSSLEARAPAR